jgi:hypothetical protein
VDGISKSTEIAGLELTNHGWASSMPTKRSMADSDRRVQPLEEQFSTATREVIASKLDQASYYYPLHIK